VGRVPDADRYAPDAVYDEVWSAFSDDELVALSIGLATINAWNRLAIGFRLQHPADRKRGLKERCCWIAGTFARSGSPISEAT